MANYFLLRILGKGSSKSREMIPTLVGGIVIGKRKMLKSYKIFISGPQTQGDRKK